MFKLNFATPDKKIVTDQELEEISLPAYAGELNILPGHAPLMTTLEAGILRYRLKNGETARVAIGWGYCQVSPEAVNVLAETAMGTDEIDVKEVQDLLKTQEERLATEALDDADWKHLQNDIARLKAELELVNGKR